MSKKNKSVKILFVSSEAAPFAKSGGLGDVVGSLPGPLKKLGADVRIIIPKYGLIDEQKYGLKKIKSDVKIISSRKIESVNIWEGKVPGTAVKIYFIDHKRYFGPKEIYFGNNSERFLFFSLASLQILPLIGFKPDVVHCHDYHSALIPDLIKTGRAVFPSLINKKVNEEEWGKIKTVFTIHNFIYQGKSDVEILSTGNLSKNSLASLDKDAEDGDINFDVQAILNADAVTTVSPSYAKEIMTKKYGAGLEKIIRKRKSVLKGILNGIDVDFFDPAKDRNIAKKYSLKNLDAKKDNKIYLQKKLGLPVNPNIPLVGFVSRLAWQKGVDLISDKAGELDCQFVFLGTGEKKYENYLKKLAKKFPNKISANIMFDVKLANQIYASSDIFLMPSRFEPCGLGQMIAMRYGAVPLVRETGGLKDTVLRLSEAEVKSGKIGCAKGFSFKNPSPESLYKELKRAVSIYHNDEKIWKALLINGMKEDFSWDNSAKKYLELYRKIID